MNVGINSQIAWISSGPEGLIGGLQGMGQPISPLEGAISGTSFKNLILQTMTQKLQTGTAMNMVAEDSQEGDVLAGLAENGDVADLLNMTAGQTEESVQDLLPFMPLNLNIQYAVHEEIQAEAQEAENPSSILGEAGLLADESLAGSQVQTLMTAEGGLAGTETKAAAEAVQIPGKANEQANLEKGEVLKEPLSNLMGSAEGKSNQPADSEAAALKAETVEELAKNAEGKNTAKEAGFTEHLAGAQQGNQSQQTGQTSQISHGTVAAEKPEPHSQISQEILSRLEKKGPMEFKMQLEPESLGKIDVNLKFHDGKLIIDILAASGRTHALLASQVDKLIQSMGLQNVQVENVQVGQQSSGQQQDGQGSAFFMNGGMDFFQKRGEHGGQQQGEGHSALPQDTDVESPDYIPNEPANYHRLDYVI